MAASVNDKFMKVGAAGTATTLAAPGHSVSGTTITVASTTNWPTDTGVVFAIRQVDSDGVLVPGTYTEWRGTVSGSTITNMTLEYGTDQVYPAGSTTQVYIPVSADRDNRLVDGILVEHDQDGTHGDITAASVTSAGAISGTAISGTTGTFTSDVTEKGSTLSTIRDEYGYDFVASGCVWTGDAYGSTRAASMTAGVAYINGKRVSISAVTARSFTASKDTYVDVDENGTLSYTEVANNAASPALAANSIRIAIIVSGGSSIANVGSVNQGQPDKVLPIASSIPYQVTDSLGNMIYNTSPNPTIIGYRQIVASFTGAANTNEQDVTGLSAPVIVPAGRKIRIVTQGNGYNQTGNATQTHRIKESTTVLATSKVVNPAINNVDFYHATYIGSPTAGSHTYKTSTQATANGPAIEASATQPAFISVELV